MKNVDIENRGGGCQSIRGSRHLRFHPVVTQCVSHVMEWGVRDSEGRREGKREGRERERGSDTDREGEGRERFGERWKREGERGKEIEK